MPAEWWYAVNNQRKGPVSLEELQAKALNQELKPTDLVWKPGFAGWLPAQKVPGIFLEKTMMGSLSPDEDAIPSLGPAPAAKPATVSLKSTAAPVQAEEQAPPAAEFKDLEKTEITGPAMTPTPFATYGTVPAEALAAALGQTQVSTTGSVPTPAAASTPARPEAGEEEKLYLTEIPGQGDMPVEEVTMASLPADAISKPRPPRQSMPVEEVSQPGSFSLRWNLRSVAVSDPERSLCMSSGVVDPLLQQYLAWRHSLLIMLLIPAGLALIFGLVGIITQEGLSLIGLLASLGRLLPLVAMAAATLWSLMVWSHWKMSRRILLVSWLIALAIPALLGLLPASWQVVEETKKEYYLVFGLGFFLQLLPTFWTVWPGTLRAALRLRELMPEAAFPGWVAAFAGVTHALLTLTIFLGLNAVVGNPLLVLVGLCFTAAPLAYLWKAPTLLRPLSSEEEKSAVALAQLLNLLLTILGFLLLTVYLFTVEIAGRRLVGMEADASWVRPWNGRIFLFPFEIFARSLLTTLVAADLLLFLNLQFWRQTQEFQGTPAAQVHEDFMARVGEQMER
jgi:hypothetical protein